jgi:hypothetical protein
MELAISAKEFVHVHLANPAMRLRLRLCGLFTKLAKGGQGGTKPVNLVGHSKLPGRI